MEEYKKVEIEKYVKEGLENGSMVPRNAEKFGRIMARQGIVGETVISWSVDSFGKEVKELVDVVEVDKNTNMPSWVVTKVDENGRILIDNNNHPNEWIIEDSKFKQKYEVDTENPNLFCQKRVVQIFAQISENITLNQWGCDMNIAAGGYINITNPTDMYGISKRDFEDTYRFVETEKVKTKKSVKNR